MSEKIKVWCPPTQQKLWRRRMDRRNFLKVGALFVAAPAIIRVADIMPIKAQPPILWGDGKHDDTEGLCAFFSGKPFQKAGGDFIAYRNETSITLADGNFYAPGWLDLSVVRDSKEPFVTVRNNSFYAPGISFSFLDKDTGRRSYVPLSFAPPSRA